MGSLVSCCFPKNELVPPNQKDSKDAIEYFNSIFSKDSSNKRKRKCTFLEKLFSRSLGRPGNDAAFWSDPYRRLHDPNSEFGESNINLQHLDARALLHKGTSHSTPGSSLDLEWEHEAVSQISAMGSKWEEQVTTAGCSNMSTSNLSRQSSGTSLEWDPNNGIANDAEESSVLTSSLDVDTMHLLNEIERLTKKALSETGQEFVESNCAR